MDKYLDNMTDTIVVEENKEDIQKMKEKLEKKERTFEIMNDVGEIITMIATPGLLSWIPTPADAVDGPIVEIIVTVAFISGVIMKTVSKSQLKKIKAMKLNQDSSYYPLSDNISESDKKNVSELMKILKEKKSSTAKVRA